MMISAMSSGCGVEVSGRAGVVEINTVGAKVDIGAGVETAADSKDFSITSVTWGRDVIFVVLVLVCGSDAVGVSVGLEYSVGEPVASGAGVCGGAAIATGSSVFKDSAN